MDLLTYLRQFYYIENSTFQILSSKLKEVKFAKNDFLCKTGELQRHLYFVQEGVQFSYFENEDKQHVIAFTYTPNLCALPESFMLQKPAMYNLKCLSNSLFLYISYEELQQLFNESQELERLFRKITEFILIGMINRHIELQTQTIEERFISFSKRSAFLLDLVPHKYIASYLSIDASNFSKLYNSIKI